MPASHKLIAAVQAGNLNLIKDLLTAGENPNQPDEYGWTPLCWAAGQGDTAVLTVLLKHSADVFKTGKDQRTPYRIAVSASRVEAARLLREQEAKTDPERARTSSRQDRPYCKAYPLKRLRAYSGWRECRVNWRRKSPYDRHYRPPEISLQDDDIVFIHQDYMVTESMWQNENIVFREINDAWKSFCENELNFKVPDDFALMHPR